MEYASVNVWGELAEEAQARLPGKRFVEYDLRTKKRTLHPIALARRLIDLPWITARGLTAADVLAFAPEHRPTVDLPVVAVPADRWLSTGAGLPPRLVMHPWQWARIRPDHPDLTDTGERRCARPLMSLRTLATADAHVKTAVTAGMTSATRTVSAAALYNGPVLSAFLRTMPGLEVLAERAGGAVLVDGEPSRHLAMIVRDAPRLGPDERALPVAALTTADDPVTFVGRFAGLLLPPLFALLELYKSGELVWRQRETFGEIEIMAPAES
jgi:hypothetical protein